MTESLRTGYRKRRGITKEYEDMKKFGEDVHYLECTDGLMDNVCIKFKKKKRILDHSLYFRSGTLRQI